MVDSILELMCVVIVPGFNFMLRVALAVPSMKGYGSRGGG